MEDLLYRFLKYFNKMPLPVKKLLGRLYSLMPTKIRYGKFYSVYRKRIEQFLKLNKLENIEQEQFKLLFSTINQSIKNVPWYRNYKSVESIEDFRELPIINKNLINENWQDFVNPVKTKYGIKTNTGGSSGTPLEFFIEKNVSRPKEKAHFDWYWGQLGYSHGARMLMVRGLPLSGNKQFEYRTIDNILNVSCYNINEANIDLIASEIDKFKPVFIHAYPSALKNLCSLLTYRNYCVSFQVKAVFLGSEYLFDADRQFFSDFFNSTVINWYGHSERLIHGGNCKYSNDYHFYPSYGYIELLDDNGDTITLPGKEGRIIATGFDNSVMPLIRYDTGDYGTLSANTSCSCGFKGMSLSNISGRGHDMILLTDGTRVSVTAFIFGQHLEAFHKIREMQIIQDQPGQIELLIVGNKDFSNADEINMKKVLLKSVNQKLKIDITYKEYIPKTHRGKNVFFVSNLKEL